MYEFWATAIAEFRALGGWCIIHGPEIWIGIAVFAKNVALIFIGMLISVLITANNKNK